MESVTINIVEQVESVSVLVSDIPSENGLTPYIGLNGNWFIGDDDTGVLAGTTLSFEIVSKNLKSWAATFNYTGALLTSITYTDGTDTIVKTFNYTGPLLTSIVLSGDVPAGIDLTKTLNYVGDQLTEATYS